MGFFDDFFKTDTSFKQFNKSTHDPLNLFPAPQDEPETSKLQDTLAKIAKSPYEGKHIQKLLPLSLRLENTNPILQSGIQGIGQLIQNPGGLSPTVADAINARLAEESQQIAQNYRGIQSQQAGAAARSNLPVSIKTALESALNVSQERAQRSARQGALTESEALRRQDLAQTFNILDAILQFISSGRGQGIAGLQGAGQLGLGAGQLALGQQQAASQNQAAGLAALGSILGSFGGGGGGGGKAVS